MMHRSKLKWPCNGMMAILKIYSYVNNISTQHGGTHLTGFSTALTRVLNNYIKSQQPSKIDKISITGEDMREGLTAVISVKVANPNLKGKQNNVLAIAMLVLSYSRLQVKS